MSDSEQKPSGFTIKDRRIFSDAGEPRPENVAAAQPQPPPPPEPQPRGEPQPDTPQRALPPVDFSTFVLSLGSSALMHLGEVEAPSGEVRRDLPMAKHTIDLLSMLQAKSKGNLTAQEHQLLESLLYDLRLRYVTATKP